LQCDFNKDQVRTARLPLIASGGARGGHFVDRLVHVEASVINAISSQRRYLSRRFRIGWRYSGDPCRDCYVLNKRSCWMSLGG